MKGKFQKWNLAYAGLAAIIGALFALLIMQFTDAELNPISLLIIIALAIVLIIINIVKVKSKKNKT